MQHHVERVSPKGGPFVGTCLICGKSGLAMSAALEKCSNPEGISQQDALLITLAGPGDQTPRTAARGEGEGA